MNIKTKYIKIYEFKLNQEKVLNKKDRKLVTRVHLQNTIKDRKIEKKLTKERKTRMSTKLIKQKKMTK